MNLLALNKNLTLVDNVPVVNLRQVAENAVIPSDAAFGPPSVYVAATEDVLQDLTQIVVSDIPITSINPAKFDHNAIYTTSLNGCALSQATVDALLEYASNYAINENALNGSIDIQGGTNAAPSLIPHVDAVATVDFYGAGAFDNTGYPTLVTASFSAWYAVVFDPGFRFSQSAINNGGPNGENELMIGTGDFSSDETPEDPPTVAEVVAKIVELAPIESAGGNGFYATSESTGENSWRVTITVTANDNAHLPIQSAATALNDSVVNGAVVEPGQRGGYNSALDNLVNGYTWTVYHN